MEDREPSKAHTSVGLPRRTEGGENEAFDGLEEFEGEPIRDETWTR